jgi:hypothetical protein
MATIRVHEANTHYFVSDDCLIAIEGMILIGYFGRSDNLVLSREYQVLGEYCFSECNSVRTVMFDEGSKLTRIEKNAFLRCSELRSICIPAGVESIGDSCFQSCKSLSQVIFEHGSRLARIGKRTFQGCLSLESICIPAQIELLPIKCFAGCRSLAALTFERESKLTQIADEAFDCCDALRHLVFGTPSKLKQLDIPPSDFGVLCIPDSVEVITGYVGEFDFRNRVLQFGRESRLIKIYLIRYVHVPRLRNSRKASAKLSQYATFLHLSEEILRRFRCRLEA